MFNFLGMRPMSMNIVLSLKYLDNPNQQGKLVENFSERNIAHRFNNIFYWQEKRIL